LEAGVLALYRCVDRAIADAEPLGHVLASLRPLSSRTLQTLHLDETVDPLEK
jgi:hypothetical protein